MKNDKILGVLTSGRLTTALFENQNKVMYFEKLIDPNFAVVGEGDALLKVIGLMHAKHSDFAVVITPSKSNIDSPVGIISREIIGENFIETSEVLSS